MATDEETKMDTATKTTTYDASYRGASEDGGMGEWISVGTYATQEEASRHLSASRSVGRATRVIEWPGRAVVEETPYRPRSDSQLK